MAKTDPISLSWLRSFVAIADAGEESAAASLGLTQSAVNKHTKKLGEWLRGPALFEGRPQRLTEKGKAFLPIAQAAIPELEGILARLAESQETLDGAVPLSEAPKVSAKNIKLG